MESRRSNPDSPTPESSAGASSGSGSGPSAPGRGIIFFDLAGTLVTRDRFTGRIHAFPGCREALQELSRDHTLIVTTGNPAAGSCNLLQKLDLLRFFDAVHGDLWSPAGKPYGQILAGRNVEPERCLVLGDRIDSDIPGDCAGLVTVLVNQTGFTLHGEAIVALVRRLAAGSGIFATFERLFASATPVPQSDPPRRKGADPFELELCWFRNRALDEPRPVILLAG